MVRESTDENEWTTELVSLLLGSALTVYNSLDYNVDYPTLKEALLTHFGVTVMGSKLRFRQSKFNGHDNAREHVNKLRPLLHRWLIPQPEANMNDADYIHLCHQVVENELIMEQFRNGMPTELQKYLDAQNPTTVEAMCQCIESYQLQHPKSAASERRAVPYSTQPRRYGNTARTPAATSTPVNPRREASKTPE